MNYQGVSNIPTGVKVLVGRIGRVSVALAIVFWCSWAIPAFILCFPAAFTVSAQESYLCPGIRYAAQYLILLSGFFGVIFIFDIVCDDSSAREREIRRQIELESPRVLMPEEEEPRD